MKRHRPRVTDCMDCWQRKHCFLFYENWRDGNPRGIWLCSRTARHCIDRRPSALNKANYTPWDSAESLTDDEVIIEYLKAALEENDPAFFVKATGNVARAKSLMVSITTSSGA